MDEYTSEEVALELLSRFKNTNGIEFISEDILKQLASYIDNRGSSLEP